MLIPCLRALRCLIFQSKSSPPTLLKRVVGGVRQLEQPDLTLVGQVNGEPFLLDRLDAQVVERGGRRAAGPESDLTSGSQPAIAAAENADSAEREPDRVASVLDPEAVPRPRVELEIVLALEPDTVAVDDPVQGNLLPLQDPQNFYAATLDLVRADGGGQVWHYQAG